MSILRQEFLTSAVKIRINAEILRARLLNREGKEKRIVFACETSHLQEQITHRSGERLQAVQAGMLLEQAASPGGFHAARCLQSRQGCGVFFYTSKQTACSSVKKPNQPYVRPRAQIATD